MIRANAFDGDVFGMSFRYQEGSQDTRLESTSSKQ